MPDATSHMLHFYLLSHLPLGHMLHLLLSHLPLDHMLHLTSVTISCLAPCVSLKLLTVDRGGRGRGPVNQVKPVASLV